MKKIFEFPQNTILEDDLVLLRPLQESDVENLLEISVNEPETWEYSLVRANGKENLENYIQLPFKTLQLGYTWYGKDFRGTGLNKHCKFLLLQFAFEILGMERVEFRADNNNERSIAAMKSIGCKVEGVLRNHMPTFGSEARRDSIILSILRNEWFDEVKDNLKAKL